MIKIGSLKQKELAFCCHYARLRNAREAAFQAGYSQYNAEAVGNKLLMKQSIIKAIQNLGEVEKQDELMQCVISGLKRLAFCSSADGARLIFSTKDEALAQLDKLDLFHVAEIKMPRENAMEIKFFDRFKALDKLTELAGASSAVISSNSFYDALEASASDDVGDADEV